MSFECPSYDHDEEVGWSLRVPHMFSLSQAHQAFGEDGRIANPTLQSRFESTLECFIDLVEAAKHYPGLKKQWVEYLGEHPDATIDRVEHSVMGAA